MRDAPSLNRHQKNLTKRELQEGALLSFTTVRHPPEGFGTEPYVVGLIELEDGTRSCAQLTTDGQAPCIGVRVLPHLRCIRTLPNGLRVNDIKYEVMTGKPLKPIQVQSYVLALTGPSGVGKTTITHTLLTLLSAYTEQVPIYTTRKPKKNEVEPYKYVSKGEFAAMLKKGDIISHTQMSSESELRQYGYGKKDIEKIWQAGKLPIVVTDINLLKGLADTLGRRAILSCGLLPPGNSRRRMLSALLHRLRDRGRDTEQQIEERLKVAETDLAAFDAHPHLFDHLLVNDKLELCVERIKGLVLEPAQESN